MKKHYLLLWVGYLFINVNILAQPKFIKDSLEKYIATGIVDWQIPGLAIAIVKDGKTVIEKGFGVANLQTKKPIDNNTLFIIASNSKLFTGTALAQLDYYKKISLEDKITKYFPNYYLYDSATTKMVTIKDMLSHRLGTSTFQGDFTFWGSNLSREETMNRMRYLKPSNSFRNGFGYCNSCFLTAGQVIDKVTNSSWENYIKDSILDGLHMDNTYTLTKDMEQRNNIAYPYTTSFSGALTQIPFDKIDNLAPATSMVSNVHDMAKWLRFQLDSGKVNGKQMMPWQVLQKTRDMVTILNSRKNGASHFNGYGLGVFISDYNGVQVYSHTGGADGFVTNTCFVPELNLGITILTNNDNQNFFEILRVQILDAYLKVPYVNKSKKKLPAHIKENNEQQAQIKDWKNRLNKKQPPLNLNEYEGIYSHQLYGNISIKTIDNKLQVTFGSHNILTATLDYMDNDEWLITYNPIMYGIFATKFGVENNKVESLSIKVSDFIEYDSYLFTKNK
jgi:CubicO group peptidase (beta-lactamase class C family)